VAAHKIELRVTPNRCRYC